MTDELLARVRIEPAQIPAPHVIDGARAVQQAALPSEEIPYWENIGRMGTYNLVAILDGRIVGYLTSLISQPRRDGNGLWRHARPYIGFVGVLPELHGNRIGPLLVSTLVDHLHQLRIPGPIWLECRMDGDGREQKSYLHAGFEYVPAEEVERIFGFRSPAPVMRHN